MEESISVIIPAYREGDRALKTIERLRSGGFDGEIILALTESDHDTALPTRDDRTILVRSERRGRAFQMNDAARRAGSAILLFLHADTSVAPESIRAQIPDLLADPRVAAGAYTLAFDRSTISLDLIAYGANLRSRYLRMPYGDQAIFLRADRFWTMGGYAPIELMEDVDLISRAKKLGSIKILEATAITSARRWQNRSPLFNTLKNWATLIGYFLGAPPERLARWYQGRG